MGLTSAKYYQSGNFFWDERSATHEDQVLQPIQNAMEMGMTCLRTNVGRAGIGRAKKSRSRTGRERRGSADGWVLAQAMAAR